ncbi:MAG TPA: hypothetical protein VFR10_08565 [bacterium]|nr:hypothetical protein [bacterium]
MIEQHCIRWRHLFAVAGLLLLTSIGLPACNDGDDGDDGGTPPIPEPELVPQSDAAKDAENVYYREWCASSDVIAEAEAILAQLLDQDIRVDRIWFPEQCSACDCVMCTSAIVLQLYGPDSRVEQMDFRPDNPWVLNCGVPNLWRYTIPQSPGYLYR